MGTKAFWRMRTTCRGIRGSWSRGTVRVRLIRVTSGPGDVARVPKKEAHRAAGVWHMVAYTALVVVKCNDGKP